MAVPVGAAMSTPSWLRPQRGPNSEVTVPSTGEESVEPQAPLTGVVPSRPPPDDGVSDWPPAGASSESPPPTGALIGAARRALVRTARGALARAVHRPARRVAVRSPEQRGRTGNARLSVELPPGRLERLLQALLDLRRDVRRPHGRAALEQGGPRGGADDAVDLEPGTGLVLADRAVGLGAGGGVGRDLERLLDVRHELALAPVHERQATLAHLDGAGRRGLSGHLDLHVAAASHLGHGHRGSRAGHGGRRGGGR